MQKHMGKQAKRKPRHKADQLQYANLQKHVCFKHKAFKRTLKTSLFRRQNSLSQKSVRSLYTNSMKTAKPLQLYAKTCARSTRKAIKTRKNTTKPAKPTSVTSAVSFETCKNTQENKQNKA
jgi:hypothetical protein